MPYDHQSIEQKWQKFWSDNQTYLTKNDISKPKKYILDMFPYPSGAGLHVGHPKGYTATDIMSRYYHANGYNVLHPMGFDAFWLPAENYAVKTGTHPRITTEANIKVFIEQLRSLGFSYDWDRMVDTTDSGYYKWTQWIFLELFKRGLAYEAEMPVNWCPALKAVLANEEVVDGKSEIGGHPVEKKLLRQWVLRITEYADRLIEDLDGLDWPEGIKEMQKNWIGKSEGCEFRLLKKIENKPTALILHGWEEEWSPIIRHWQTWLKWELERHGYEVFMPDLPGHDCPNLDEQLSAIEQYKSKMSEDSIIVGHSMGGFLAMHFVESLDIKIHKLICIAPIFNDLHNHVEWDFVKWDARDVGFSSMKNEYLPQKIKEHVEDWKVFLSEDDPYILYPLAKKHFDSIGVSHTDIPNSWHFISSDGYTEFDILLESILPSIRVYTTRVDTVYGMTYAVLAPDHPDVQKFITDDYRTICDQYIKNTKAKTDLDRTNEGKEKTWVFTWSYVINPYNNEPVQLWIADYVLWTYGTGAVMAVPAHDERDFEFAKKYDLDIRTSIVPQMGVSIDEVLLWDNFIHAAWWEPFQLPYTKDWFLYNSDEYTKISSQEARTIFSQKAEKEGFGHKKTNYKLRDWLFSRQRYWGEPIPLIHITHEDYLKLPRLKGPMAYVEVRWEEEYLMIDGVEYSRIYEWLTGKLVIDSSLPLLLPEVEKYEPSGDGQSPLATVPEWVTVHLAENLTGNRETNTMPQWWGSCWYYLRYMDNKNSEALASRDAMDYWGMVDEYVWGAEHAVLHLLYARFWHKVLYDIGVVPQKEPFHKLTNVGMILAYAYERQDWWLVAVDLVEERDGRFFEKGGDEVRQVVAKMSKSLKNVVNPNDIVSQYGADTLRLYEMSMSGFTDTAPWNPDAIIGVRRFLDKAYITYTEWRNIAKDEMKAMKLLHKTIKKVWEDIQEYKFNTAISALMILLNEWLPADEEFRKEWKESFSILLHPFAPHMAEELYWYMNNNGSIYDQKWPEYDEFMLIDDDVIIAVQVNGKLRGTNSLS